MPNRRDVILLYLFPLFPGLPSADGQHLVQLAGMVDVMACDYHDYVIQGGKLSPMHRTRLVISIV